MNAERIAIILVVILLAISLTAIGYNQNKKETMKPVCDAKGGEVVTIGRTQHICVKKL